MKDVPVIEQLIRREYSLVCIPVFEHLSALLSISTACLQQHSWQQSSQLLEIVSDYVWCVHRHDKLADKKAHKMDSKLLEAPTGTRGIIGKSFLSTKTSFLQGSQPIREIRENYFTFFQSGNLRKMSQIREKSGKFEWNGLYIILSTKTGNLGIFFHSRALYVHNKIRVLKTAKIWKYRVKFLYGILRLHQGKIREKSGNFVFLKCWEPCFIILIMIVYFCFFIIYPQPSWGVLTQYLVQMRSDWKKKELFCYHHQHKRYEGRLNHVFFFFFFVIKDVW